MISDERLAELKRLDKAATPGPWIFNDPAAVRKKFPAIAAFVASTDFANDELIVAARNALPDMLATIQQQAERVAALEEVLRDALHWISPVSATRKLAESLLAKGASHHGQ